LHWSGAKADHRRVRLPRSSAIRFVGGWVKSGDGICVAGHAVATFIERGLGLILAIAAAWAGAVALIYCGPLALPPRPAFQAVSYSVLPLGRQILKLTIFLIAILSGAECLGLQHECDSRGRRSGWYAAVALAAQKTIEDLFGGVSVISDRPVLVGDICRFGDRTGTVMHIGLRSTRIRTPDRTVVSIPNAQFATMTLENISGRDKIWFHPTLNLRRDTTSEHR
jgi:MscS family membrane protein